MSPVIVIERPFASRFESHQLLLQDFHIYGYLSFFLLDLALLIFNLEKCMGSHFEGNFAGYPYRIYLVYIE